MNVQFLVRIFLLSLTVGSFCALGFDGLINVAFFLYVKDSPALHDEFFQDQSFIRYFAFSIMMFVSMFRFPTASFTVQQSGRYASNGMNGISVALLDNYALFILINNFIVMLSGSPNFSPRQPVAPAFLCGLTALSFIAGALVSFPTTANLPEYSLEQNPIHPTFMTKTARFFSVIKEHFLPETNVDTLRTQSSASVGIEFVSGRLTRLSRVWSSQFYPSTHSVDVKLPTDNPLHAPKALM